jgi:hypothetical protein
VLHCKRLGPSKLTFFKSEGYRKMERLNGKLAGYNEVTQIPEINRKKEKH